jgi:hypothetical protein
LPDLEERFKKESKLHCGNSFLRCYSRLAEQNLLSRSRYENGFSFCAVFSFTDPVGMAVYGLAFGFRFLCLYFSFEASSAQLLMSRKATGSGKTSGL